MFTFNWQIRQYLKEFNDGTKPTINISLLLNFVLRANAEGQFYPATETLAHDLGVTSPTIGKARKWLYERATFVKVPYRLRTGKMKDLPVRQTVYQLTGMYISNEGELIPYLYMNPETQQDMFERVKSSLNESKHSLLLKVNTVNDQHSLPKGISILLEGISKNPADKPADERNPKKEKKPSERDELVDTITTQLFKAALTDKASVKQAAILAAWVRGTSTGTKSINVGKNEHPSNSPQDIVEFVSWWGEAYKDAHPPTSISKFPRWWRQWCKSGKPKATEMPEGENYDPTAGMTGLV